MRNGYSGEYGVSGVQPVRTPGYISVLDLGLIIGLLIEEGRR